MFGGSCSLLWKTVEMLRWLMCSTSFFTNNNITKKTAPVSTNQYLDIANSLSTGHFTALSLHHSHSPCFFFQRNAFQLHKTVSFFYYFLWVYSLYSLWAYSLYSLSVFTLFTLSKFIPFTLSTLSEFCISLPFFLYSQVMLMPIHGLKNSKLSSHCVLSKRYKDKPSVARVTALFTNIYGQLAMVPNSKECSRCNLKAVEVLRMLGISIAS